MGVLSVGFRRSPVGGMFVATSECSRLKSLFCDFYRWAKAPCSRRRARTGNGKDGGVCGWKGPGGCSEIETFGSFSSLRMTTETCNSNDNGPGLDLTHRSTDLLVGLVLAQGVDGPDGGGEPADQRDLQDKADDSGDWAADGEEGQPGNEERDDESQSTYLSR